MTDASLYVVAVIVTLLAVVQSVFGVGLLVFGTPILLLLGLPFESVLSTLLPCSILISLLQTASARKQTGAWKREVLLYCVPCVAVALSLSVKFHITANIRTWVGAVMIVSASTELLPALRSRIGSLSRNHRHLALAAIGSIHGFTNMGGGLLTVFCNAMSDGKESLRASVSFAYLFMAISQILVLVATGRWQWDPRTLLFLAVTGVVYLTLGQRAFHIASEGTYRKLMTGIVFSIGALLCLL